MRPVDHDRVSGQHANPKRDISIEGTIAFNPPLDHAPEAQAALEAGNEAHIPVSPSRIVQDTHANVAVPPSWPFSPFDTQLPRVTHHAVMIEGDSVGAMSTPKYQKGEILSRMSMSTARLSVRAERKLAQLTVDSVNDCQWKRAKTIFARNHYSSGSCSYDFCSRVDPDDMRRCFDPDIYDANGHVNIKTADDIDWREGASPDCKMCYPKIDCAAIDTHCQKIEEAEATAFVVLSSLLMAGLLFSLFAICWRRFRDQESRQLRRLVDFGEKSALPQMRNSTWSFQPSKVRTKQYDGTGIEIIRSSELHEPDMRAWKDRMQFVQKTAQQAGREVEQDLEDQRAEREDFEKEREERRGRSMPW